MKSTIRTENKDSRTGTEIDRQLKRGNGRADKCSHQRVSNNWRQQNTIMPSWTFPIYVNKSRIFYLSRNNVWFKCSFMFWNSAYSIYTKNYTNNSTQVILMKANAEQGELTSYQWPEHKIHTQVTQANWTEAFCYSYLNYSTWINPLMNVIA